MVTMPSVIYKYLLLLLFLLLFLLLLLLLLQLLPNLPNDFKGRRKYWSQL